MPKRYRLAGIDLDGTLLSPDLSISPENLAALQRLHEEGVEIVLASGRHYRTMQHFFDKVHPLNWVVSAQGGEASNMARTQILHRALISPEQAAQVFHLGHSLGYAMVVYGVDDVCVAVPTDRPELKFYTHLVQHTPRVMDASEILNQPIFKVIALGSEVDIDALMQREELKDIDTQQIRTHQEFLEFVPYTATKGTALHAVGDHLGITPEEVVVFGDADNDIPMFEWAGDSVAMPHGWPDALKAAKRIAPPGPPESAFARAVKMILEG
jgi:Cof subfamily protein (haloacid dehalogenase superfamily)